MPITPFLGNQKFDPETTRIMGIAFEMAREAVKRDWGCLYASHSIATRIIELAKDGERNPDVLCEQALSYFLRPWQHPNESPGHEFGPVGDHPAWKLATADVILQQCGSHSATIFIDSENIHVGTGLSGAGLFLKAAIAAPFETGIILEPDRDKAEAAAKEAIERLRRMPPSARSPGMVPGAVGHNDPEDHAAF